MPADQIVAALVAISFAAGLNVYVHGRLARNSGARGSSDAAARVASSERPVGDRRQPRWSRRGIGGDRYVGSEPY